MAYKAGRSRAAGVNYIIGAVVLGLIITVLAGWLTVSQTSSSITKSDLDNNLVSLNSYAAESRLLADQYVKARATSNYTVISARKLMVAVSDLSQNLKNEQSAPDVAGTVQKTINYADVLSTYLAQLSMSPDKGQARQLDSKIHEVAQQIKSLDESR